MNTVEQQSFWIYHNNNWICCNNITYQENGSILIKTNSEEIVTTSDKIYIKNNYDTSKVGDLINLIHLHEPAILRAVKERYDQNLIYTQTGPILLSINPFKETNLYSDQIREKYHNNRSEGSEGSKESEEDPHLYRVAENALNGESDQTILISGESGSGKTVATKIIMDYIAKCNSTSSSETNIVNAILQSNPVLEAFGNAVTIRNDNSSRFGKFIQLKIKGDTLIGAEIKTYLLEKVRVIKQGGSERNFHIMYQFLANRGLDPKDFKYTNSSSTNKFDQTEESINYENTFEAMRKVGFSENLINMIMNVIYAILLLGNIEFVSDNIDIDSRSITIKDLNLLDQIVDLLKLESKDKLIKALCGKVVKAGNEECYLNFNIDEAQYTRDSIAKYIYEKLFQMIVVEVNRGISGEELIYDRYISLLDIFGFEIFDKNSFEQICINYTNERLQELFNDHIFKLEQEEYSKEGVEWEAIDFPDNLECLNMLNKLFDMTTEECLIPKGNDINLVGRMEETLGKTGYYLVNNAQRVDHKFEITHYAGNVEYDSHTFVDKNKDLLSDTVYHLLEESKLKLNLSKGDKITRNKRLITVMSEFKKQLNSLLNLIKKSTPHYIRCLKPNDQNIADNFVEKRVLQQLRYSGVLEAIKISRAGYPIRYIYSDLIERYNMIMSAKDIDLLLENIDVTQYQKGNSKLFMKRKLFDILESKRTNKLNSCATKIKTIIKGFTKRKQYLKIKTATVKLQSIFRMWRSISQLNMLRREKAATIIRKTWLAYYWYMWLKVGKTVVIDIQKRWRKRRIAAVKLQSICRMMMSWARFRNFKSAIISLQTKYRINVAKKVLKQLKLESKNLKKVMDERDKYKEERDRYKAECDKYKKLCLDLKDKLDESDVKSNFKPDLNQNNAVVTSRTKRDYIKTSRIGLFDRDWELVEKSELLEQQIAEMKMELDEYKRKAKDHAEVEKALGARMEGILIERDGNLSQIILLKQLVKKLNSKRR